MDGFIFIAIVILLALSPFYIWKKHRENSQWRGIVTDRHTGIMGVAGKGSGVLNTYSYLDVKTDDGSTKRVNVSSGLYEQFKIGDKIVKRKGEWNPAKA